MPSSENMNVWLLAENWPPRRGGIENYLTHVAEQLARMGHVVTVIAPPAHSKSEIPDSKFTIVRRRFFWPLVRPQWLPLFIWLWRRASRDRPDLIICGKGLAEGLIGYYLYKHRHIPYIVCTYAMEIAVWSSKPRTRRTLHRALGAATAVTFINSVTRDLVTELGVDQDKLVKLAPGVDDRFLKEVAPSLAESTARHYGIHEPYVLSVGRLVERKGFDTLIEAFSRLDQTQHARLKLVIAGDGPDRARLEKVVADNYMQTSVVWLPAVADKHLPALYAGATLFALTPREVKGDIEGFGIVYLEAAAVGKATLGTTSGGVPEAVVSEKTGLLVEPHSVSAVAAALSRLLTDEALRSRLGSAGAARVRQEFEWSHRAATLDRLIKPLSRP